jgi:PhnB protein
MQVNPYLNFEGHCEAAFTFYAQVLGGQVGTIFRYARTKLAAHVPAATRRPRVSRSRFTSRTRRRPRVFQELSTGGRIVMALEKTFWADRFGMVVDRFGMSWMVNCGGSQG